MYNSLVKLCIRIVSNSEHPFNEKKIQRKSKQMFKNKEIEELSKEIWSFKREGFSWARNMLSINIWKKVRNIFYAEGNINILEAAIKRWL